jgi:CheY-like chemotaxis protein
LRILVVDDSDEMRLIQKSILVELNACTDEARHGQEALTLLEKDPTFDLIILDIDMPEMGGVETLIRIKENEATKSIPVLMCSTACNKEIVFETIRRGAKGYIRKPFTTDSFVRRVESVLAEGEGAGS